VNPNGKMQVGTKAGIDLKILITTIVDPKKSAYSRMHAFAKHLGKNHKVIILSVNDSWKEKQSSAKKYEEEYEKSMAGIETVYITEKKKSVVRQELFSKKFLKKYLNRQGPFDIILDYNTLSIGRRAQEILGDTKRIYDLADDLVDMVKASPQLPAFISPFAAGYASGLINKSIRRAQIVTGTTGALLDRYEVPAEKRYVIPNGIPNSFLGKLSGHDVIDSRKEPDEFMIGYVGVLRGWVDFEPIFNAMKSLQSKIQIRLVLIGEEDDEGRVRAQIERAGVTAQVSMLGTVSHDMIRNYLVACDCGIVPFVMSSTSDYALPLKVFEYLSAGLPVISTPIKSVKENFSDSVWFYEDTVQFVKAITDITSNRQAAKKKVEDGMKKVESEFTWDRIIDRLEKLIVDLAGQDQ